MTLLENLGVLLTTDVERVPLGVHRGYTMVGRTQQRHLRIALGSGRRGLRLALTRARPVAVEATDASGRLCALPIGTPADPWLAAAGRLLLFWALSLALTAPVAPARGTPRRGHAHARA